MGSDDAGGTPEQLFDGHPDGLALFRAVRDIIATIGQVDVRVTTSQIAFRRQTGFAYVWRPAQYVRSDVPAVLSIALRREIPSHRFKTVAHPSPGVWMHHLELRSADQLDEAVTGWLAEAYVNAG
ncbi:MAG TPA: DUF5655 domain-containing protein [Propionicimonas sp.]